MTISPGPTIIRSSLNLRRHDLVFPVSLLFRVPSAPTISPTCCGSSTAGPSDPGTISCVEVSGLSIATSHPPGLRACQNAALIDGFPGSEVVTYSDHLLAGQRRHDRPACGPKSADTSCHSFG